MIHQHIFKLIIFHSCCCFAHLSFGQAVLASGEHFATVNGVQIQYFVSGKGPVCLLPSPGWGASVNLYRKTLRPFEEFFTMVYYNARSTGKSTGPNDSTKYTKQHFVDDMEGLRLYLNQPKVWLIGHSAGGYQVLSYGIQHSDKLNGIIAINASACRDTVNSQVQLRSIRKRFESIRSSKGEAYFDRYYGKADKLLSGKDSTSYTASERLAIFLPLYFHDEDKVKYFPQPEPGDSVSGKAQRFTRISKFDSEDLCSQLSRISVPTLVVTGDDDVVSDKSTQSDEIAKSIASSAEIVIKEAGHFPWIEQLKMFFSECISWLERQGLRRNK